MSVPNLQEIVTPIGQRRLLLSGVSDRGGSTTIEGTSSGLATDERLALVRGLSCGPLITGVIKEVSFKGGGRFSDFFPRCSESGELPLLVSDQADF